MHVIDQMNGKVETIKTWRRIWKTPKFHFHVSGSICPRPLLEDKQRFPDSSFTASASSEGHSASDARIFSGSSWCAPVSNGKHYLQVDLGRLYVIDHVAIFGDSTSLKYVTTYNLNYTVDFINWKSVSNETVMVINYFCHPDTFQLRFSLIYHEIYRKRYNVQIESAKKAKHVN